MLNEQGDQEPADAAAAIEERMDRLELHVGETNPNQRQEGVLLLCIKRQFIIEKTFVKKDR